MEVARDPFAIGDDRELLAVGDRLGAVERQRRLVGEGGEELALLSVGRGVVEQRDQCTDGREVSAKRDHDGVQVVDGAAAGFPGPGRVDQPLRPGQCVGHEVGVLVVACRDPFVVGRDDRGGARSGHGPCGLGDAVQPVVELHRGLEGLRDLRGGLEPLPPPLAEPVGTGVVDDRPRRLRQRLDEHLVLLGEVARSLLLGEVQVAVDGAPDADGDTEEAGHRRVVGREAGGVGVVGEVVEPQRSRFADQQAEDAVPAGQVSDATPGRLVDALGDEVDQHPVGPDDPQGAVRRAGERRGGLHDPAQHRVQVEVGADGADRPEQGAGLGGEPAAVCGCHTDSVPWSGCGRVTRRGAPGDREAGPTPRRAAVPRARWRGGGGRARATRPPTGAAPTPA